MAGKCPFSCGFMRRAPVDHACRPIVPQRGGPSGELTERARAVAQGDRMRKHRPFAGLWLATGILVAACGSGQAQVTLPKKAEAKLERVVPASLSQRQLVVIAYEGYWQATNQAINSRDPATARSILTSYVPGGAIAPLITGMKVLWQRDEVAFGAPVFHIVAVKMTGAGTAAVHDCIDLSHTGFQNRRTGQIVGGLGQSHDYLITTLARQRGRWLVTGAIPVVQSCAY